MIGAIKVNGMYGTKVGNLQVFTYDGAEKTYKNFLEICYKDFDISGSIVLSEVEESMIAIGYTWEQLEQIENDFLEKMAV